MKIKDIKDPKIQQMAVVEAIKQHPDSTLENIMNGALINATASFDWNKTSQGGEFWTNLYNKKFLTYTDKGLWYINTMDNQIIQCKTHYDRVSLGEQWIRLATLQEVYNHLKQKDMSNPTYGKNTIYKQEEPETYGEYLIKLIKELEEENKMLKANIKDTDDMISCSNKGFQSKIKELEEENKQLQADKVENVSSIDKLVVENVMLSRENKELNKLVDEIEFNCEDQTNPRMKLNVIHKLIYLHRNPSIIGTTQTIEIDGKKYEITINKEI